MKATAYMKLTAFIFQLYPMSKSNTLNQWGALSNIYNTVQSCPDYDKYLVKIVDIFFTA